MQTRFVLARRVWVCVRALTLHSCSGINGTYIDMLYLKSNTFLYKPHLELSK